MSDFMLQTFDMSGMEYIAPRGKQMGNLMQVVGPDQRFVAEDKWLIRSTVSGDVWSVEGDRLRELLKEKIEQRQKRLQEIRSQREQEKQYKYEPKEAEPVAESMKEEATEPAWMDYDLDEFRRSRLVLTFYSKLLADWMIIVSHISMLQSHADEVKEQYEKHGGAVYTIDELNELIGTDINRDGLKNFHLLKKTFGLRYVGKARTK